ncbi:solute carrier family 2, facilitated glucose transporter member 6-like [Schistocerca gregaria]|uniref:solute carrier family 2, facilitated glucose transporter member 6-like n=1 Tax=Schistocerca gregaria TaxID=7010 RepID=UPI00211DD182|nr:solute carrier family 2, facilitated glucose transporter member 6-like [Schistocerca gregaria]
MAWSPATVPILQEEDSPVPLTPDQGSWIVSINSLTGLAAILTTAYAADVFGRKMLMLVGAVPALIWWLMVAFASSYEVLITARAIGSLTGGFIGGATTMFVCEIADIEIRGTLMAFHGIFMYGGSLLMYCIVPYLPISTVAFSCMSIPVIFLVTFVWMPKSPYFYLLQNRESEAVKSLVRYKGELTPEELQFELETMYKAIRQKQETKGKWKDTFLLSNSVASAPIGSLLTGEVFHVSVKAICLTLYSTVTALYGFVLKKLFQVVSDGLGAYYSFWAFSFMCFVCAVYMYKLLPETRGKTFAQINDDMEYITGGHVDDDNKDSVKTASG